MKVNFGGFVPLSTVDWRGRAVCTLFMRGCPVRCNYCHNKKLQTGSDLREISEVIEQVKESRLAISGIIFSGGEPTGQKEALLEMARECKKMGLKVGIHTNGIYPDTIRALLSEKLLDLVHLDIKTRWEHYPMLLKVRPETVDSIKETFKISKAAYEEKTLSEFLVVCTMFRGREDDVGYIAKEIGDIPLVLQQGVYGQIEPLSFDELKKIAETLHRDVKIRTREYGEVTYSNNQIFLAGSSALIINDISQARRNY